MVQIGILLLIPGVPEGSSMIVLISKISKSVFETMYII